MPQKTRPRRQIPPDEEILPLFLPIDEKTRADWRSGFPMYLFYTGDRTKRTYRCSACGTTGSLPGLERTMYPDRRDCTDRNHNENSVCPFCGCDVVMKCLGRFDNYSSLFADKRLVRYTVISRDVFVAQAFYICMCYRDNSLFPALVVHEHARYYFSRTGCCKWVRDDGNYPLDAPTPGWRRVKRGLSEPWPAMYYSATVYIDLNTNVLKNTYIGYFDHCKLENSRIYERGEATHTITYLHSISRMPQIEYLQKMGLNRLAKEILQHLTNHIHFIGRKDINYRASGPREFLGLNSAELREFIRFDGNLQLLSDYKLLRQHGLTMTEAQDIGHAIELINQAEQWHIEPCRIYRYLARQRYMVGCHMGYGEASTAQKFAFWSDYLSMASRLHIRLYREDDILPRDLQRAHDDCVTQINAAAEAAQKQAKEKEAAKLAEIERCYQATDMSVYAAVVGKYMFRAPATLDEIRAEGIALHNCVGGYAARHGNRNTTIIFCRDKSAPDKPLYCMEYNKSRIVQFYGNKNTRPPADAREAARIYAENLGQRLFKPEKTRKRAIRRPVAAAG